MILRQRGAVPFYQFRSLAAFPVVRHAVFTRLGGQSKGAFRSLNAGQLVGDEPQDVQENLRRISQVLGVRSEQLVTAHQVHGANVAIVRASHQGAIIPASDGLICREHGVALLLRFADCLPVLLFDPTRRAIGLLHAGWRGCLAGIVAHTVTEMVTAFGSRPGDIVACLGPAIGPCCYQIGPEVVKLVRNTFVDDDHVLRAQTSGGLHLDLPAAVEKQLCELGIMQIEQSGLCTHCHSDQFFSHRADLGRTGRFAAVLALRHLAPAQRLLALSTPC